MSDSIFYIHGLPVAVLSSDGRYRRVELTAEDRDLIEEKLNAGLETVWTPIHIEDDTDHDARMLEKIRQEFANAVLPPPLTQGVVFLTTDVV